MPSAVVTSIFRSADTLLNQTLFGEAVVYTPYGGAAKSITMRIDRGADLGRDRSSKVVQDLGASDAVSCHAIGYIMVNDAATPIYLDSITSTGPGGNSEVWTVLAIMESDSSMHTIALRDDLRPQL